MFSYYHYEAHQMVAAELRATAERERLAERAAKAARGRRRARRGTWGSAPRTSDQFRTAA
ncbi:hypothetical protein AQ490_20520 [Wenjunlia vitaminophila]|uniref:Uncharacterized protein n=1 Tax=Wenjunlia vitaminophila TaxID=76728 RepID=A0A0T6LUA1_WENVI|nr:hypothetical protein [Wenjunlia vitaminophila]KRV49378.1 hypothetical protein AQ490_20520 [Wenjunlia vitaminophila]